MDVLTTIWSQIAAAQADLHTYRPDTVNWNARAAATADNLIPWLLEIVPAMKSYLQDVLNAPALLRSMWATIRQHVNLPKEQIEAFDRQLTLDDVLRESVTGEVVSNVVSKYLIEHHPASALRSNGRSDYPDLYLGTLDYSALPQFKRKKKVTADDEYGAAVKGKQKRPVRVPDGLEIKTCRQRIAVDCHHPHAGLHLVLLFTEAGRMFTVEDVRIAFLRSGDYRESERNTTATTVKYSFGGEHFISLLGDQ
ncbi:MAG: hypothetical protein ACYC3I_26705 [Gemmataceae bacterium]